MLLETSPGTPIARYARRCVPAVPTVTESMTESPRRTVSVRGSRDTSKSASSSSGTTGRRAKTNKRPVTTSECRNAMEGCVPTAKWKGSESAFS